MPENPIVGIGNTFEFGSVASPTTFTTLAGVNSISPSGDKVSTEKTTTMAAAGGVDTFIASTQDPGSLDVKGFFYPGDASQTALEAIRAAGQAVPVKITYGSSNSFTSTAIVESFTPSYPLEKPATLDVKLKLTSVRVFA